MPTAAIRSRVRRSSADKSRFANHSSRTARLTIAGISGSRSAPSPTTDSSQQSDKPDHDGTHAVLRLPQRNRIGVVRTNAFHQIVPKFEAACDGPSLVAAAVAQVQINARPNETAALLIGRRRRSILMSGRLTSRNQLLRSPSAARFHCVTLSAIMRVDFIAAWLSWA